MRTHTIRFLSLATLPLIVAGCVGASTGADEPSPSSAGAVGQAEEALGFGLTSVPSANPKSPGLSSANALSLELMETAAAQGSVPDTTTAATFSTKGTRAGNRATSRG